MNDFEKKVFSISHIYANKPNYDKSYSYILYDFASKDKYYRIGQYSEIKSFTKHFKELNRTDYIDCIIDYYELKDFIKIISNANYGSIYSLYGRIFRREIYEYIKNEKILFHYGRKDNPIYFHIDDIPYSIDKEDKRYIKIGDMDVVISDRINRLYDEV